MKTILRTDGAWDAYYGSTPINKVILSGGGNTKTLWDIGPSTIDHYFHNDVYIYNNGGADAGIGFTETLNLSTPIRPNRQGLIYLQINLQAKQTYNSFGSQVDGLTTEVHLYNSNDDIVWETSEAAGVDSNESTENIVFNSIGTIKSQTGAWRTIRLTEGAGWISKIVVKQYNKFAGTYSCHFLSFHRHLKFSHTGG